MFGTTYYDKKREADENCRALNHIAKRKKEKTKWRVKKETRYSIIRK